MKKSIPQPLDVALKNHYRSKSLSTEQVDHLLALQTEFVEQQDKCTNSVNVPADRANNGVIQRIVRFLLFGQVAGSNSYRYAFQITAGLLLMLSLALTLKWFNQPSLSQQIMDEIAYNHQQRMPIEVASASLAEVRNYLNKLNFPLIASNTLAKPNWQLLGGRYCSINGKIAAQLKLKNLSDNNVYTLYQAAIDGELEQIVGDARTTKMIDGVGVSIWQEKGLLLGLASSP